MRFRTKVSLDEFTRPQLLRLLGHNVGTGTNKGGPKIRALAVELLHAGGLDDTNEAELNRAIGKIKRLRKTYKLFYASTTLGGGIPGKAPAPVVPWR